MSNHYGTIRKATEQDMTAVRAAAERFLAGIGVDALGEDPLFMVESEIADDRDEDGTRRWNWTQMLRKATGELKADAIYKGHIVYRAE